MNLLRDYRHPQVAKFAPILSREEVDKPEDFPKFLSGEWGWWGNGVMVSPVGAHRRAPVNVRPQDVRPQDVRPSQCLSLCNEESKSNDLGDL